MTNSSSHRKLPEPFCAVPFSSLIFSANGDVCVCREQGKEHVFGNIKEQSVESIWNGEKLKSWRREFLTGEIKTCAQQIKNRRCNRIPWNQELLEGIELSEHQPRGPQRMSPDFNGRCNLRCAFCRIWQDPNGLYDEIGFWDVAKEKIFPYLKQLDLLHGEPLIHKDTYRLMDIMAELNPACEWRITSNGQWKLTDYVKGQFDKTNLNVLSISLDTVVAKTYAKIRAQGEVKDVLQTIEDLITYRRERKRRGLKPFDLHINTSVQQETAYELKQFLDYVLAQENCIAIVHMVYVPKQFSILSWPESKRIELLAHYFETMPAQHIALSHNVMTPIIDSLSEREREKFSAARLFALQSS